MAWGRKVFRDANHLDIVMDLRKCGKSVIDLAAVGNSCPDIVAADRRVTALIEIKMRTGVFYLDQLEFLAKWPGVAGFAETTEDAIDIMDKPECRLTEDEKMMIRNIVIRARQEVVERAEKKGTVAPKNPKMLVTQFEKRFREAGGRI